MVEDKKGLYFGFAVPPTAFSFISTFSAWNDKGT